MDLSALSRTYLTTALDIVKDLMEQLSCGTFRVNVVEKFDLEKIGLAYAAVQERPVGKVVVSI